MTRPALVAALAALLGGCPKPAPPASSPACGLQPDGSRVLRVLHINDTYRIEGLPDGRGGLARLRTLRRTLEADCGPVLVTHAGDLLYPSLLSRRFGGEQMVDALNRLDGDADAFDPLLFATFGNHEFDKAALRHAAGLDARVDQSGFTWVDTHLTWATGEDGAPLVSGENLVRTPIVEVGGVRVGLFSLGVDSKVPAYVERIETDHVALAAASTRALREAGAEVVIALTHLDARVDVATVQALSPSERPDLVLGGHDHVAMTLDADGVPVLKADADAVSARVIEGVLRPGQPVSWRIDAPATALGPEAPPPDPELAAAVDAWLSRHDAEFCAEAGPDCLDAPLSVVAGAPLRAEELEIRRFETNLGDWAADLARDAFAEDGAQVAIVNAGGLRLNHDLAVGTPITRRTVEELFAYPTPLHLLEVDGATLRAALGHAVTDWTGAGHFLQVSGLAYVHDVEAGGVRDVHLLGEGGPVPLADDATVRVVAPNYLLDPSIGDQDGYTMLSFAQERPSARAGVDLKQLATDALRAAGPAGVDLPLAGRICTTTRPEAPCAVPPAPR